MANQRKGTGPRNALIGTFLLTVGLIALLLGAHQWSDARLVPKLGLDLEGGTQMILEPKIVGSQTVRPEQLNQARDIIVQRVDAGGIAGAEVTTQGDRNIVVAIPGTPDEETLNAIRKSSQLQFRPVLALAAGSPQPSGAPSPSASPPVKAPASPAPTATPAATPNAQPGASATPKSAIPNLKTAPTPSPSGTAASPSGATSPSPSPAPSGSATGGTASGTTPSDPTSLDWITPELQQQFIALNCADSNALDDLVDDPAKPLITCDADGAAKYILGPVVVEGSHISDASAGYQPLPNGQPSTTVEIALKLDSEGAKKYAEISKKMVGLPQPQNQLAATLDSQVIVAPRFQQAILDGQASITGSFTIESARALAQQLKFGALPMSFTLQTMEQISPTLGSEQLRYGFIAGLIGLGLVALYSLAQYRVLGFVTIATIVVAGLLTYLALTILGWSHNYRLDMAGVTGVIVAIGFTADSFIVYFERIRDELRDGRSLEAAVATGWDRAKRTILIADGVNFIAAIVLYLLASAGVRGFAFTLGLTTLLDILLVFTFTHPLVATLARRPFFRDGHPWSGMDPRRLGVTKTRYLGRGRFGDAGPRPATSEGSAS